MKKFNSQICTTRKQGERLLALGLKKKTADMVLLKEMMYDENNHCTRDGDNYLIRPIDYLEGEEHRGHIPAWSLHRLIEMMPEVMYGGLLCIFKDSIRYEEAIMDRLEAHFEVVGDNMYENAISCIEWLIKEGYFNKEYLCEK